MASASCWEKPDAFSFVGLTPAVKNVVYAKKVVILSECSESRDLRISLPFAVNSVPRSLDSLCSLGMTAFLDAFALCVDRQSLGRTGRGAQRMFVDCPEFVTYWPRALPAKQQFNGLRNSVGKVIPRKCRAIAAAQSNPRGCVPENPGNRACPSAEDGRCTGSRPEQRKF